MKVDSAAKWKELHPEKEDNPLVVVGDVDPPERLIDLFLLDTNSEETEDANPEIEEWIQKSFPKEYKELKEELERPSIQPAKEDKEIEQQMVKMLKKKTKTASASLEDQLSDYAEMAKRQLEFSGESEESDLGKLILSTHTRSSPLTSTLTLAYTHTPSHSPPTPLTHNYSPFTHAHTLYPHLFHTHMLRALLSPYR